mgnify:CR=1 FL=1
MYKMITYLFALALFHSCASSQSILELGTQQSMSITGKGPGQDAAINPYDGNDSSISVVKNLGETPFSVRIQKKGNILSETTVSPGEKKEFVLEKGHELYLDSEQKGTARVTFKKVE